MRSVVVAQSRTSFAGGAQADELGDLEHVRHVRGVDEFVLWNQRAGTVSGRRDVARMTRCENVRSVERGASGSRARGRDARVRTGIFFCVTTHTLSLPRTPMDVIPTDLIALNAYSARHGKRNGTSANRRCANACGAPGSDGGASEATGTRRRTDLVQATLGAEDGDVAVIPRAAAARHLGRSSRSRARDECRPVRPARFKKVTPRLANDRRRSERRAIARTD